MTLEFVYTNPNQNQIPKSRPNQNIQDWEFEIVQDLICYFLKLKVPLRFKVFLDFG